MYQQPYWQPTNSNQWQTQNYIQQPQQYIKPTLPGRIVDSINDVTPNEVPMDGSVGIFMLRNMSELYSKAWASDGTIKTIKYIPEPQTSSNVIENVKNPMDIILERLDKIEELIRPKTDNK